MRPILAMVAVLAVSGCSLDKQTTPPLSGPSEIGLALAVTATPDIITQDGQSQATVRIVAYDESGQPRRVPVNLLVETFVDGLPVDFGVLSTKTISTGPDGVATLTYRSPAAPLSSQTFDTVVEVNVTPVGINYTGVTARSALIRLARPGVILPPNGTPTPRFFFSPTTPKVDEDVFFNGSGSTDTDGQIVTYTWDFGDGRTTSSSDPTTRHSYGLAGTHIVTLRVTDDRGLSAVSTPQEITVGASSDPTATFVTSPAAPKAHTNVGFNASGSKAAAGRRIVQYIWDFGDASPIVSTDNAITNHSFAAAGGYNVTLKVVDDTGKSSVVTNSLTIAP